MGATNAFNPVHVPTAEQMAREQHVLELRRAGVTFDRIAEQVGFTDRGTARKAYLRALARCLQEPAAEVRQLEGDRLDRLQVAVWTKALSGNLQAVDRVLRIMERRAKLLGLDHASGIAEQMLQLEQGKARMVAVAVGIALEAIDASPEQRETFVRVLMGKLRVDGGDDGDAELEGDRANGVLSPVDNPVDGGAS